MSWNYRIGTEIYEYQLNQAEFSRERVFSIVTVYYDEEGNPKAYGMKNNGDYNNWLSFCESINELKGTVEKIQSALSKPVIDLDNFPNEFKNE